MKTCCVNFFLLVPWAFFVAAMDYIWGFPFGYLIVPIVIWLVTKQALKYTRIRFVLVPLVGSYGLSIYLAYLFENDWGYFFKPLNLIGIVHTWSVVTLIGVLVILIYHGAQKVNQSSNEH
ncbi:hypothetical protein [Exiguobacterium qingdaonense]|uniref:hypothetical protein n=1 Tax=Exiguobacterium qingdaonense TaxID=2751251 RepID=UPI001BE61223|nr:hypothetical protein [Exiguobacterium qingdaonense]